MVAGQINGRLVGRVSPYRMLAIDLSATASGGAALLAVIALGGIGLAGVLPALFVVAASMGFVLPNSTTLALSNYPRAAGSASALLGVLQYAFAASAAPLVGVGGSQTALPMALVICALGVSALAALLVLSRGHTAGDSAAADLQTP